MVEEVGFIWFAARADDRLRLGAKPNVIRAIARTFVLLAIRCSNSPAAAAQLLWSVGHVSPVLLAVVHAREPLPELGNDQIRDRARGAHLGMERCGAARACRRLSATRWVGGCVEAGWWRRRRRVWGVVGLGVRGAPSCAPVRARGLYHVWRPGQREPGSGGHGGHGGRGARQAKQETARRGGTSQTPIGGVGEHVSMSPGT